MESTAKLKDGSPTPTRRPGGRTADVTQRLRAAVMTLLLEGGVEACTTSNIAERAGIDRSTLYRRYPDRWGAIIDTVIDRVEKDTVVVDTGSFAGDLKAVLSTLADLIATPMGPAIVTAAGTLHSEGRVAAARVFFERRMDQLEPMFDAAVRRGELAADVDREELFTFAVGTIWFSKFIASRIVGDREIDRIVAAVCAVYCLEAAQAGSG